jgi:polysaccharide biosynthesis protein PelF
MLCKQMSEVQFTLYAMTGIPQTEPMFALPPNADQIIRVPLWGMQEPAEFIRTDLSVRELHARKQAFTEAAAEFGFVPHLRRLLWSIYAEQFGVFDASSPESTHADECGRALYEMWKYFQRYDWNSTWKASITWESFAGETMRFFDNLQQRFNEDPERFREYLPDFEIPTIHDLTTSLRALHHHLMFLNASLPQHDIVHSTLAGFAGMAGILAKHAYGTPFVVTEHGIFVREQYISIANDQTLSPVVKRFLLAFSNLSCKLIYAYADAIAPVCAYNSRWEIEYGADPAKIHCIYNSVDTAFFVPQPKPPETAQHPTVVASARVFALKDIETMIRAAWFTRKVIPDVQFIVFGATGDEPEYYERCLALVRDLGLSEAFTFAGLQPRSPRMYTTGDISVLSSISEAFPYAVLEAMSCERAVVATDVGGIREVLHGCGIVVPPRNPEAFSEAIIQLLNNAELRTMMGKKGREETIANYQAHTTIDGYRALYKRLHEQRQGGRRRKSQHEQQRQQLDKQPHE